MWTTARHDACVDGLVTGPATARPAAADLAALRPAKPGRVTAGGRPPWGGDPSIPFGSTLIPASAEVIGAGGLTPARPMAANPSAAAVAVRTTRARRGRDRGRHRTDRACSRNLPRAPWRIGSST